MNFLPHPPDPLPLRGRGRFWFTLPGAVAPGTPATAPGGLLADGRFPVPEGACPASPGFRTAYGIFTEYRGGVPPASPKVSRFLPGRGQPRRVGGPGGEEPRRLRWSSPPGAGQGYATGESVRKTFMPPSPRPALAECSSPAGEGGDFGLLCRGLSLPAPPRLRRKVCWSNLRFLLLSGTPGTAPFPVKRKPLGRDCGGKKAYAKAGQDEPVTHKHTPAGHRRHSLTRNGIFFQKALDNRTVSC